MPDKNEILNSLEVDRDKKHIVLDCDEILCYISPKWTYLLHQNYDYFSKYLNLKKDFDLAKDFDLVLNRPYFFLDTWLFKHDEEFSSKEIKEFKDKMMSLYDTSDFYDNLPPTPFGNAMSYAIGQSFVENVSIVTRSTNKNRKSKEKFIYNLFNTNRNKLNIFYLDIGEKKSDVIKTLGNDIGAFADDELENLEDVATNCDNLNHMNFYVPRYGYNVNVTEGLFKAIKDKSIELLYYSKD